MEHLAGAQVSPVQMIRLPLARRELFLGPDEAGGPRLRAVMWKNQVSDIH